MNSSEFLMETHNPVQVPLNVLEVAPPPVSKGEREYRAFQRLLPQLLHDYRGKYVAVHEERVVDSDADDVALVLRFHAQYGYVPVHVGLVTDTALPPIRVPHYRLYRPTGEP
jgi:hypothetical protein